MTRSKGSKVGYPNVMEKMEFHSGAVTGEILCLAGHKTALTTHR